MFDQQDGDAAGANGPDQVDQTLAFGTVEAGGGFVEQQQFRPRDDGARDLDQPLRSVGQCIGFGICEMQETDKVERLAGALDDRGFFALLRAACAAARARFRNASGRAFRP